MVSRPIVAGPLAGLLLGDPVAGVWTGALLEILSLHQLPVGASRGWDTGPAVVAGTAVAALSGTGSAALLVAAGYGVLVGWTGSWSVHALRHLNSRLVAGGGEGLPSARALAVRHLAALVTDFIRALGLTLLAVWLYDQLRVDLGEAPALPAAALLSVVGSLSVGTALRMMAKGRRVWTAFGVGAVLSAMVALWLA